MGKKLVLNFLIFFLLLAFVAAQDSDIARRCPVSSSWLESKQLYNIGGNDYTVVGGAINNYCTIAFNGVNQKFNLRESKKLGSSSVTLLSVSSSSTSSNSFACQIQMTPCACDGLCSSCIDSDNGKIPETKGTVTINPRKLSTLPPYQTMTDSCLRLLVTRNSDGSSTTRWESGTSGTHVSEFACSVNNGQYENSVMECKYGCSDGACINSLPSIKVISPNGGEEWFAGTDNKIEWYPSSAADARIPKIDLYILDVNGNKAIEPSINRDNTGFDTWTPRGINGKFKVRICVTGTNNCDESDNYFYIYECVDSDNGANPYSYGQVTGPDATGTVNTYYDQCGKIINEAQELNVDSCYGVGCKVYERVCIPYSDAQPFVTGTNDILCEYGCENGACLQQSENCRYDDSNGNNIGNVYTSTKDACFIYWDSFGQSRPNSKVYYNNYLIRTYEQHITCTDSDNSPDYYVSQFEYVNGVPVIVQNKNPDLFEKGYAKGKYGTGASIIIENGVSYPTEDPYSTYFDWCSSDTHLEEAFCTENIIINLGIECPNGCKDGACIEKPVENYCNIGSSKIEQKDICSASWIRGFIPFSSAYQGAAAHCGGSAPSLGIGYSNYKSVTFKQDYKIRKDDNITIYFSGWASGSTGPIIVEAYIGDGTQEYQCGYGKEKNYLGNTATDAISCNVPFTADSFYVRLTTNKASTALIYLREFSTNTVLVCQNGCLNGECISQICGNGICEGTESSTCFEDCHITDVGYSNAKWECYDGTGIVKSASECIPSEKWQSDAKEFCYGHCSQDGSACGVNSFSVWEECILNSLCSNTDRGVICDGNEYENYCSYLPDGSSYAITKLCPSDKNSCELITAETRCEYGCSEGRCIEAQKCGDQICYGNEFSTCDDCAADLKYPLEMDNIFYLKPTSVPLVAQVIGWVTRESISSGADHIIFTLQNNQQEKIDLENYILAFYPSAEPNLEYPFYAVPLTGQGAILGGERKQIEIKGRNYAQFIDGSQCGKEIKLGIAERTNSGSSADIVGKFISLTDVILECKSPDEMFFISGTDTIKDSYVSKELSRFIVIGTEPDSTYGTYDEGFGMRYTLTWIFGNSVERHVSDIYPEEDIWAGTLIFPYAGEYELKIEYFCRDESTDCSMKYGNYIATEIKYIKVTDNNCFDSDGGKNYYSYGETTGYNRDVNAIYTSKDMCLMAGNNNADLQESWCENNELFTEVFNCPYGCINGKCKPKPMDNAFKLESEGNRFNLDDTIGNVIWWNLSERELPELLESKFFKDDEGEWKQDIQYVQELKFHNNGKFTIETPEDERINFYQKYSERDMLYTYWLHFDSPVFYEPTAADADLTGNEIYIMGKKYILSDVGTDSYGAISSIGLLSGEADVWLEKDQVYSFGGHDINVVDTGNDGTKCGIEVDGYLLWIEEMDIAEFGQAGFQIAVLDVIESTQSNVNSCRLLLGAHYTEMEEGNYVAIDNFEITGTNAVILSQSGKLSGFSVSYSIDNFEDDVFVEPSQEFTDPVFGQFGINFYNINYDPIESLIFSSYGNEARLLFLNSEGKNTEINWVFDGQKIMLGNSADEPMLLPGMTYEGNPEGVELLFTTKEDGIAHVLKIREITCGGDSAITVDDLTYGMTLVSDYQISCDGSTENEILLGNIGSISLTLGEDVITYAYDFNELPRTRFGKLQVYPKRIVFYELQDAEMPPNVVAFNLSYDYDDEEIYILEAKDLNRPFTWHEAEDGDPDVLFTYTQRGTILEMDNNEKLSFILSHPQDEIYADIYLKWVGDRVTATCTDSDGGINQYQKGTVHGLAGDGQMTTDTDSCWPENYYGDGYDYVAEWYCTDPDSSGTVYRTNNNILCEYGCSDGACMQQLNERYELSSYPFPFYENGQVSTWIVVSENAPTSDVLAAIDIVAGFSGSGQGTTGTESQVAVLDKDIIDKVTNDEPLEKNLITVGNACYNRVSEFLLGNPAQCTQGLEEGKGRIAMGSYKGKHVLLADGYNYEDTRAAATVLAKHNIYELKGESCEVINSAENDITVICDSLPHPNVNKCQFSSGLDCIDMANICLDTSTVTFVLRNNIGFPIEIQSAKGQLCENAVAAVESADSYSEFPVIVQNNQVIKIQLRDCDFTSGAKQSVNIVYENTETGLIHTVAGEINGDAKNCLGPEPIEIVSCLDSDGKDNFNEQGYVEITYSDGSRETRGDDCGTTSAGGVYGARDYWCSGPDYYYSSVMPCEFGCNNGVCNEHASCSDSDGGKNFYSKGQLQPMGPGEGSNGWDYCYTPQLDGSGIIGETGTHLLEWYCTESGLNNQEQTECEYGCEDGACIRKPDLANYPEPFIMGIIPDVLVVVGKSASTSDVIAAIDIATSLGSEHDENGNMPIFNSGIAILDSELGDTSGTSKNLIVIGNPCVNAISAELLGNPSECAFGFEPGNAILKLFDMNNGKLALLVAGYNDADTLSAARILAKYRDYDLSGDELKIVTSPIAVEIGQETALVQSSGSGSNSKKEKILALTKSSEKTLLESLGEEIDYETLSDEDAELPKGITEDESECSGCMVDKWCMPYGTRLVKSDGRVYCNAEGEFKEQKNADFSCESNYECKSNICFESVCVDLERERRVNRTLYQRILDFLGLN